jgi:DNA-binding transcriptional MerR regulator
MVKEKPGPSGRSTTMQIGVVSKQTGASVDAIRFYERRGLLSPPPRSTGRFRIYKPEDAATVGFIRRMQALGFSLREIRELLALRANPLRACATVRNRLRRKLVSVRAKLGELRKLETELRAALRQCNREIGKRHPRCPVVAGAQPRNRRVLK